MVTVFTPDVFCSQWRQNVGGFCMGMFCFIDGFWTAYRDGYAYPGTFGDLPDGFCSQ